MLRNKGPEPTYTVTVTQAEKDTMVAVLQFLRNLSKRGKPKRSKLPPFRRKYIRITPRTFTKGMFRPLNRELILGGELNRLISKLQRARRD